MPDPTAEFFDGLSQRGYEPMLRKISGSVRFDLEQDWRIDYWHLEITQGNLTVSRAEREADTVVRTAKAVFDRIVRGETQALAAYMRNEIAVEGKLRLFLLCKRLVPGPAGARAPQLVTSGERRP